MDKSVLKIAILNDLIGIELSKMNINQIIDPIAKSKMRNLKKTTDIITNFVDNKLKIGRTQEIFGELCDQINDIIDDKIGDVS